MRASISFLSRYAMLLPLLAVASGLTLAAAPGCTGTIGGTNPGQGGAGGGGLGGAGGGSTDPLVLFAALEEELMTTCSPCHGMSASSGYPFMVEPLYDTLKNWNGIVIKQFEESKFIAYAGGDTAPHSGTDLTGPLYDQVRAWLEAEAALLPDVPVGPPTLGPFRIRVNNAYNIVYFHEYLGEDYFGVALSFIANQDMATGDLSMTGLTITTPANTGVSFSNITLKIFEGNTSTDVTNNPYASLNISVPTSDSAPFNPADLTIPAFPANAQLAMVFGTLMPNTAQGGTDCAAGSLASFESVRTILEPSCATAGCHGVATTTAGTVMDLSNIADAAVTCRTIKGRTNLMDYAQSQILQNTDPAGGSMHPFKFPDATAFGAFSTAVQTWVAAAP